MKTKEQKSKIIKDLSTKMSRFVPDKNLEDKSRILDFDKSKSGPKADIFIFTSYSKAGGKGLSVSQMRDLKRSLRLAGGEYIVAKKNLVRIATEEAKLSELVSVGSFEGSVGLVLGSGEGDSIALSKSVYDFAKANPSLRIFGAVLEQRYLDADRFTEFAKLTSKEMLFARLFGMLQYPVKSLLVLLNNIKR